MKTIIAALLLAVASARADIITWSGVVTEIYSYIGDAYSEGQDPNYSTGAEVGTPISGYASYEAFNNSETWDIEIVFPLATFYHIGNRGDGASLYRDHAGGIHFDDGYHGASQLGFDSGASFNLNSDGSGDFLAGGGFLGNDEHDAFYRSYEGTITNWTLTTPDTGSTAGLLTLAVMCLATWRRKR